MIMEDQLNLPVSQLRLSLLIVSETISLLRAISFCCILPLFTAFILFFLHSLKANLSAFSFPSYDLSTGRNYMFLVCNGIVVYIVKSWNRSSSENENENEHENGTNDDRQTELAQLSETKVIEDSEEEEMSNGHSGSEAQPPLLTLNEGEDEKEKRRDGLDEQLNGIDEEQDQHESERKEEEEVLELLSTEELNKRCDEFIRRMKDEIFESMKEEIKLNKMTTF
ncbi:hypothetical protein Ancab_008169 [Ancistrocladus abbreviatus]